MKSGDGDSPNEVCHCVCCLTGTRQNTKGLWKSVQRHMKRWLISWWGSWVVVGLESPLLLRASGAKLWNKRVVIEWLAERGRAQRLAVKPLKALSAYDLFFCCFFFLLPLLLLAALLSFCFIPSHRHCLSVCPSPSNISLHFGSSSLFESSRLFHFPQPVLLLVLTLPNVSLYVFSFSTFLLFPLRSGLEWSLDSSFHWGHFSISTASVNITNTSKYKTYFFFFFYHHPKTWLCFWTPHSVIFVQSPTLTHILQVH